MGRPPTTVLLCEELHSFLLDNGIPPGAKIPRPLWDKLLAKARHVSWAQAENITRTGATHGLWERRGREAFGKHGSIVLLPQTTATV